MIPVFKPHIDAATIKSAVDALELGWLGMGSYVKSFEEQLARFLELPEPRRLVAVNTCTSALHLALRLAEVGPGDEVITPALNNIGDFQAIGMCGARPVFVDLREDDLGIDPELVERAIGPRTKAIIALHYMGIPCRVGEILEIARRRNLRVIEDAAHAIGTRWNGKMVGSYGDLACYSFDAIKTLTCIDGGAVVTRSAEEADRLYPARLLGMTQPNDRLYSNNRAYQYDVTEQGFRYHLANLHASVGLSQLAKLPEFITNRRGYCLEYNRLLGDLPGVIVPRSSFEDTSVFHYVIRVLDGNRAGLAQHLKARGIDTGIHWIPGNRLTWLRDCRGADQIPITDRVGDEILTLPLWSYMTSDVIERVATAIREFCGRAPLLKGQRSLLGRELLVAVKQAPSLPRAGYSIPVDGEPDLFLRVVSTRAPHDDDVRCLTEWRNRHVRSFLTEFEATEQRTREWLTHRVASDDARIIFMIEDRDGVAHGYLGLADISWASGTAEADSVVRGRNDRRGIMRKALTTLVNWGRTDLGLSAYAVRVLGDNPALSFYEDFGFQEVKRLALTRIEQPDCVAWAEASGAAEPARSLVHMELMQP